MNWFFWRDKRHLSEKIKIETGGIEFSVSEKGIISDINYKGAPLIKSVSFFDLEPEGLNYRFDEAFFALNSSAFNNLTNIRYKISSSRKRRQTQVFMNGAAEILKNKMLLNYIVTATEDRVVIEVRVRSAYKAFWGVSTTIEPADGMQLRAALDREKRKTRRSEHPGKTHLVCEGKNTFADILSTYGTSKLSDEGKATLSPYVEGTDREVVSAWKVMPDLSNYNTIVIEVNGESTNKKV